ncbi:FMN-binding protein [Spongiibacter sp. KMU-166]|uniref:FMN-binding protein n=2 Tax=Spongiibacter thalassae TaxID=2721624 RepID=A0ABX1GKV6_9GAMM|nr:FMN-binding protein [Spongiibacter thalassae]
MHFSPATLAPARGALFSRLELSSRYRRTLLTLLLCTGCLLKLSPAQAFELYKTFQTPDLFLAEVFSNDVPQVKVLMLNSSSQQQISAVFNRPFPQQRVRYWEKAGRSVWIFDDIGKEGYVPTTCGFVVENNAIKQAKVLIYRESRGEQVGEDAFLNQLKGAKAAGNKLDVQVDNITGATLSVKMMERMARTALALAALR